MICPNCGARQPENAPFCMECGAAIRPTAPGGYAPPPPGDYPPTRPAPMAGANPGPGRGDAVACANCGAQLEPDSAFCDMCGARVAPAQPQPPTPVPPGREYAAPPPYPPPPPPAYDYATPPPGAQAAYATPAQGVPRYEASPTYQPPAINARLVVVGSTETLPLPPGKPECIVGRADPIGNIYPDVDLTDCGGDDAGVSRQHARIYFQAGRAFVEDRESTNHTYVNGQKLTPWQPHPLRSGDEVRFGRLKLTFYM